MIARIDWRRFEETSLIFSHYIYQFEQVKALFPHQYRDKNSFHKLAKRLNKAEARDTFQALAEDNKRLGSPPDVVNKLKKAAGDGALAVVSGQQPGLFGGPAYTLFKALTAVKLARFIEKETGTLTIPIFFPASEDHDINEVNRFTFINREYKLTELSLPGMIEGRKPVYSIHLGSEVKKLINTLKEEIHPPGIPPVVEQALSSSYTEKDTFSSAFARLLVSILSPYGIAILDPASPKLKEKAVPLFEKEIIEANKREEIFSSHIKELSELGYHIQVPLKRGRLNLFFVNDAGERQPIYFSKDEFTIGKDGEKASSDQLISLLKDKPERFSPDVLLRPLYQDFILPTIAYVAGPAEIAYFAELAPLYDFFDIPMPLIYPRASFTIVDDVTFRLTKQLPAGIPDFITSPDDILDGFKRSLVDTEAEEEFSRLEKEIIAARERFKGKLAELDRSIGKKVDSTLARIVYQLELLKIKLGGAKLRKKEELTRRLDRLKNILAPTKKPQERMLGWLYFLAEYGEKVLDNIYQEIELPPRDHKVIMIER